MSSIPWVTIVILTLVSFGFANIWYGKIFGNLWCKMHGMDPNNKQQMEEMKKGMWKIILAELVSTFVSITGLSVLIHTLSGYTWGGVALLVWFFFLLPIGVSDIIWGSDTYSDQPKKIAITAGFRLIIMLLSAYVLVTFA